jgi:hypothetical protein
LQHRDPDIVAAREALKVRLVVVRKAEREAGACGKRPFFSTFPMFVPSLSWQNDRFYIYIAQKDAFFAEILRGVVGDASATMPMIEAALERSPEKYASVLPAVRELRDTLERTLALRRTELSQWRRRLSELATERCGLAEAEEALAEVSAITPEVLAMVQPQREALEQWAELAAAEAVVLLKQLYADSPASIHTDTERIFAAVEDLQVRNALPSNCPLHFPFKFQE